jgi:large subunit ribosomal protein L28
MATCFICHKGNSRGYRVSHSSVKTKRLFKPNLHKLRCEFEQKTIKAVRLCSKCYKKIKNDFWEGKKLALVPVSLINQARIKNGSKKSSTVAKVVADK